MSNESTSLVNLGDLAKPATVLIEKISNAVGTIYEPTHITRVAKAQAAARIIEAESNVEIAALQQRALQRFVAEETRKQGNIESITTKALEGLKEDACPQDIEDDWIANFFDKCKLVSNEEMQKIWAKILAGEANMPGTFSRKTINLLSILEKKDAELLEKVYSCCWYFNTINTAVYIVPIIFNNDGLYRGFNMNFDELRQLEDIGLVKNYPLGLSFSNHELPKIVEARYDNTIITIELDRNVKDKNERSLSIGEYLLTNVGIELIKVCEFKADLIFFDLILKYWIDEEYIIYSQYPKHSINDQ